MSDQKTIIGTYRSAGKNYGFVVPKGDSKENDCFVPPRRNGGAWDGDEVEACIIGDDPLRPGHVCVNVTEVITRSHNVLTGTLTAIGDDFWLQTDHPDLPDVKIFGGKYPPKPGHKAAVLIGSFGDAWLPPLGAIKADFGRAGSRAASVDAILFSHGMERTFPPNVRMEAEAIRLRVPASARRRRLDLRKKLVITIDPASAMDLDDAVSLEKDEKNHRWTLGVHIADVSHYVPYGSAMDMEACRRGASVYFANQVVPMLPERLSNGVCSISPHVERLTLSCIMTLSPQGDVLDYIMTPSVIQTTERMTYEDCNLLLKGEDPNLIEQYANILPMLTDMAGLAKCLRKRRFDRGGLDMETYESRILCDENDNIVEIQPHRPGESEKIIEEFMILANQTVARYLLDSGSVGVYRVHEKPTVEKVESLRALLAPLGLSLQDGSAQSYQSVLNAVRDTPEAQAVHWMVLRGLMKARYTSENLGHFGLAAPVYCHFTSPIRRYPDLMVHHCIHALWDKQEQNPTRVRKLAAACERAALRASEREIEIQTAEREIEKIYFAEYLQRHMGETFQAMVSGVTRLGIFVTLPSGIEGIIPVDTLPRDSYAYHEGNMALVGEQTGVVYRLGLSLQVTCAYADPETGRVEFRLAFP